MKKEEKHNKKKVNHVLINHLVRSTFDPKNDKKLRQRTPLIDHIPLGGNAIIFFNEENNHLILGDKNHYKTFPLEELKLFTHEDTEEGNGSSSLTLKFQKKRKDFTVFVGEQGAFKNYLKEISNVTGLEVQQTEV